MNRLAPLFLAMIALLAGRPALLAQDGRAQGWHVAAGVGPFRIDRLAGTPVVPAVSVARTGRLAGGVTLWGVRGAGFYSLDALALDLDLGVPFGTAAADGSITAGPSVLLGGDSDGTPYIGGGGHLTVTGTWWMSRAVGLTAAGTMRGLVSAGSVGFMPSAWAGLRLRL